MTMREIWKKRQEQWSVFDSWKELRDPARLVPPEQGLAWAQTVRDMVGGGDARIPKVSDYAGLDRLRQAFAVLSLKG